MAEKYVEINTSTEIRRKQVASRKYLADPIPFLRGSQWDVPGTININKVFIMGCLRRIWFGWLSCI